MPSRTLSHYTLEHELGHGQDGTVYLARDMRLDRRVAIKVLNRNEGHAWAEMLQEARLASCLDHRHICTVYDVGEAEAEGGDLPYIAMEYVDGPSLAETLESGPLEPTLTLRFAIQLCEALTYAHEQGVIHRDVKASNVLIGPEGEAKLADFGLALRFPRGTAALAQGDIWAFGTLLYQMATGENPLSRPVMGSPGSPKVPRSVPRGLALIIERCMDTDSATGYHSAREVLRDLRIESGHPRSLLSGTKCSPGRHRLLLGAFGLLVAATLTVGVETARRLQPSATPSPSNARPHSPSGPAGAAGKRQMRKAGRPEVKVWVIKLTMKYHCPGSPWYGLPLTGQYLTQKEAQKAGYAPAYGAVCP
jgi:serine/threonine-protein kinase